jgi:repressor LexA
MELKDYLKKRRKELKLTMEDVANACGVSKATVSRWESGYIDDMKSSRISSLAKILRISPSVIIDDEVEEYRPVIHNIPLYDNISCGHGLFINENPDDYIAVPDRFINPSIEYFANIASGDSMTGKDIKDGDVLVFEKTNVLENGQIGSFCVDDENYCKVFRRLPDGTILLESANDKYDPVIVNIKEQCFRIIGKYKFKFSVEQ